jgi:hypothetical protein
MDTHQGHAPTKDSTHSADVSTPAYIYTPVAPYLPSSAPEQRYYSRTNNLRALHLKIANISVYRFAHDDTAIIALAVGDHEYRTDTRLSSTPTELREIANRLLDAASDIELNPASKLMAELDSRSESQVGNEVVA